MLFALLLCVFSSICNVAAQRNLVLHLTRISVKFDKAFAGFNVTYNDSFVSFIVDIRQQLNPPLRLRTFVKMRSRDVHSQQGDLIGKRNYKTFANTTINYCEFLRHPEQEPILNLMHNRFIGNPKNRFIRTCPIAVVGIDQLIIEFGNCISTLFFCFVSGHIFRKGLHVGL